RFSGIILAALLISIGWVAVPLSSSGSIRLEAQQPQSEDQGIVHEFDLQAVARLNPRISTYSETSPTGSAALRFNSEEGSAPLTLVQSGEDIPWEEAAFLVADV